MNGFIAILALFMVLGISIILFLNELYYRRRVSACGLILLACTVFLLWYLRDLNEQLLYLATELARYQQVDLSKGP